MKRLLPLALLAFALAAPSSHAAVYTSELSFPSAPAAALADFPVLVWISAAAPSGFSYADCPDASHLWFADGAGASLPFEVDTWDTNGTSLVWVSVPALSNSATIAMHWADDTANVPDDIPASREVWTRAGYNAVWHFAGSATESVTNLAATAAGSPSYNGNTSYPGPLGKTLWLDGSSYLSVANDPGWATVGENSTLTISCWARSTRTGSPGCDRMISSMSNWKDTSGYELTIQNDVKVITVGSSGANGTGSQFQTTISTGVNAKWQHFAATYTATTTSLYVDGAAKNSSALNPVVSPVAKLAIGAGANAGSPWAGGLDEVRIRAAASTAAWIAAEYATMTDAAFVGFGPVTVDASVPSVATPIVTHGADGTFTVAAEVSANVPASIVCIADGDITNGMATADAAFPMTYSAALAGLAADTTYVCAVTATSTNGTVVKKHCPAAFYNGDLSVSKVSDANEDGLIPGSFRISRADTAHDLAVAYTIGGTAAPGQSYEALSGTATIPAGSASVDIDVVPIRDSKKVVDTTVVVTLAAGPYGIDENSASATLTIVNTPPYSSLFAYRIPIAVSGYAGESTLSDFPVLVALAADSPSGFDYADCAADGSDIRFLDESDNVLSHEIETWATDGTSYIWVKVPSLAGKNTRFSLYYGTNGVSQLPEVHATNVWSRYAAVFHGGSTIADATGKSATVNVGTVTGSATGGKAGGVMTKGSAIGVQFSNPVTSHALSSASRVSVSGWFKRSNSGSTAIVAAAKNDWYETGFMALVENGTYFSVGVDGTHQGASGKGALTKNVWGHLAFSYDSTALKSYFNGTSIYENASAKSLKDKGDTYWAFGSCNNQNVNCFQGDMDELRVFDGVASADWIKAECDSVDSPATFVVLDDARPAGVPYVVTPVVTREAGVFSVTAEILEGVPASVAYDADRVTGAMATSDAELPMVYSATLSGLAADTTYKCSVVATATGGFVSSNSCPTAFYNGNLAIEKLADAKEYCLVPGTFRISRADTAHDLVVNLSAGGTATPGQSYEALPASVTIPDGADHVDVPLTPLADEETTDDVTVVVSLAAGNYGIPSASSATLTVVNIRPVKKTDYEKSMAFEPSPAALEKIGAAQLRNFPVLVRLPAEASAQMKTEDGTDLFFEDETCTPLSYEVEAFDPSGTTLVWVKVPSLSSATRLVATFRGLPNLDNVPSDVWPDYAGVWHLGDAAGTTADSTANANDGTDRANVASVSDGAVGKAKHTSNGNGNSDDNKAGVRIPSSASFNVAPALTMSMWYRPTATVSGSWAYLFAAKSSDSGESWGAQWRRDTLAVATGGNTEEETIAPHFDAPTTVNAWTKLDVTISDKTISVYTNGALSATKTSTASLRNGSGLALGSMLGNGYGAFMGDIDEARLRGSAVDATWAAVDYQNQSAATLFDAGAVEDMDPTAQVFKTPTAVRNANGTYTVTIELEKNDGDVGVIYDSTMANVTNVVAAAASPGVYADTPSNLTADKTYRFSGYGKNANGTQIVEGGGVFYNGEISIVKVSDANEDGLVPGVFRLSRADTAHDLTVAYAVGGTAVANQSYAELSGTATIPAGTNSVDIAVAPLLDARTTSNTTVSVTLAAGLYGIDAQNGSAELSIANLATPAGYNVWIATEDGLASVGSNWSEGHAPTSSESVLFDGRFSTKDCEWDAAASATVASWTQTNGYTGTVTFDTEFPDYAGATFPLFTISGDCTIASGKWSCRGNYNNFGVTTDWMNTSATAKRWCLNVSVGGDMEIASGASVTVTGRGYGYPSSNAGASPAYGGYAHGGATAPYGSITEPFDPGKGALAQGDQRRKVSAIGGGAVKLAVAGTLAVDGSIVAVGTTDLNTVRSGGSGGSIWIAANQISGSGTIDASGCPPSQLYSDLAVSTGSGGRIALYTQSPLAFPMANVSCNGTAYQGKGWNSGSKVGGPGTIYVKDPTQAHGTLYVKQSRDIATLANQWTGTPVMGDLALDAVVLSGNAQLRIPAGTSLTLPSLSVVTTDSDVAGISGIVCAGGTLNIGNGDQTLKANVAFSSPTPFAFPANLTLESGARLGALNGIFCPEGGHFDTNFTVSVAGDLVIPAGATAGATRCCSALLSGTTTRGVHGGSSLYNATTATNAYDSVLNPSKTGSSTTYGFRAGGVFNLTVGGTLSLDGTISADGSDTRGNGNTWAGAPAGSAGSINLRLGALSGSGAITAQGGSGAPNYAGGAGGGRVAVRLTGRGSTFSDHWKTNVTAYGVSFTATKNEKASSAGTVYLQEAANAEAAGLVLIRNDLALQAGAVSNLCATPYPGKGAGCDAPDALKRTSLLVAGAARVALTDSLRSVNLDMDAGATLDLAGHEFTVTTAHIGGTNVPPGVYTAAQMQARDFAGVVDTADGAGGTLVVHGRPTVLIIR